MLTSTSDLDTGALRAAGVRGWLTKTVRSSDLYDRLMRIMSPELTTTAAPEPRSALPDTPIRALGRVLVAEDNLLNQLGGRERRLSARLRGRRRGSARNAGARVLLSDSDGLPHAGHGWLRGDEGNTSSRSWRKSDSYHRHDGSRHGRGQSQLPRRGHGRLRFQAGPHRSARSHARDMDQTSNLSRFLAPDRVVRGSRRCRRTRRHARYRPRAAGHPP